MRSSAAGQFAGSFRRSAPIFAALGDASRLAIVARLCGRGPASITGLSEGARITRQAVTKHLRVLADAGLVTHERAGRETVWELRTDRLDAARRALDDIGRQWDAAIDRLKTLVEE
jgi:DNA-binding transcriptional ArsR family regulator